MLENSGAWSRGMIVSSLTAHPYRRLFGPGSNPLVVCFALSGILIEVYERSWGERTTPLDRRDHVLIAH